MRRRDLKASRLRTFMIACCREGRERRARRANSRRARVVVGGMAALLFMLIRPDAQAVRALPAEERPALQQQVSPIAAAAAERDGDYPAAEAEYRTLAASP